MEDMRDRWIAEDRHLAEIESRQSVDDIPWLVAEIRSLRNQLRDALIDMAVLEIGLEDALRDQREAPND